MRSTRWWAWVLLPVTVPVVSVVWLVHELIWSTPMDILKFLRIKK